MMQDPNRTLLERLRNGLIVSCQSNPGEAFHSPEAMSMFARSALAAGAVGIRAQGLQDMVLIHHTVDLPQIGLWKSGTSDVFITPTLEHALAVAKTGAEIVALDGTTRSRPDGLTLRETISAVHDRTGALVMADVATVEDAHAAEAAGADIVGTTLSGYTDDTRDKTVGPDFELLATLVEELAVPVFAEGRIRTPDQAAEAILIGAHSVVVGTAITDPTTISSWFIEAIRDRGGARAVRADRASGW